MRITDDMPQKNSEAPLPMPRETAFLLHTLQRLGLDALVVAKGQYSPYPHESERVFFYASDRRTGQLKHLLDSWLPPRVYQSVLDSIPGDIHVTTGSCSAMAIGRPVHVWAQQGPDLLLWKKGRLVGKFNHQSSELRTGYFGKWHSYTNDELSCSHGFLSSNWLKRGVRLCDKDGKCIVAVQTRDPIVFIDPTYDSLDLMCDASWVPDLAKSVAYATGLPVELDAPLS